MSQKSYSFFQVFFHLLQSLFSDIRQVYRNFLHWNLSKMVISFVSFLIALLVSLPFFLVLMILMYIDSIDWISLMGGVFAGKPLGFEIISQFLSAPFFVVIEFLVLVLGLIGFIAGYNYIAFLSARLYISYKDGKRLQILRKDYFNKDYVVKFLQIFLWQLLYLLIPIISIITILIVVFFSAIQFLGGFEGGGTPTLFTSPIFAYSLLAILVIAFLSILYIGYRIYFALFLFADTKDTSLGAKEYIKKSINITKGPTLFIFITFFLAINLILSPLYLIGDTLDRGETEAKDYIQYKTTAQGLEQDEQIYYQYLQEKFTDKSDDQVIDTIFLWNLLGFGFSLLLFLFLDGIMYVVSIWFYKEILLRGKKQHKTHLFSKWWKKGEL